MYLFFMRTLMNRTIRLLFAVTVMSFQAYAQAQGFTPSAEQIQQFKSMSPAQQQQMAEAAGIDLGALINSHQTSKQPVLSEADIPPNSPPPQQTEDAQSAAADKQNKSD